MRTAHFNLRTLVGITEIANFVAEFTAAIRSAGRVADSAVVGSNEFYVANRYTYFRALPRLSNSTLDAAVRRIVRTPLLVGLFFRVIRRYDIFVYVWNETFLPLKLDILLLRLLRKRVIVFNCGDDVRFRPIHNRIENTLFGIERMDSIGRTQYEKAHSSNFDFLRRFFTQKLQEWLGCTIVTMRNQATFQGKPAFVFRSPTKRLLNGPRTPNRARPLIVHAPTDRSVKGTHYVIGAIEQLRRKGIEFDFELIEKQDNSYVLKRLIEADILIDQPGSWIGRLGAEALAASCIVVGGNLHRYEGFPEPSPVVQFRPDIDHLGETIEALLRDPERRARLMSESFAYWERNYSYESFIAYFDEILQGRALTLEPIPDLRRHLLNFADNAFQRTVIRLFF
jgi:glycosyltransferase involved in cell wall biosynthesis